MLLLANRRALLAAERAIASDLGPRPLPLYNVPAETGRNWSVLISTTETKRNSSDFGFDVLYILIAPNVQDLTPVSF